MPPPVPPSVNAGRMMAGSPHSFRNSRASSRVVTVRLSGCFRPRRSTIRRNASRSSARWMTSRSAPIISTPCFCRMPLSQSAHAQLSAVWPPSVGSSASMGEPSSFSLMMIFSTVSGVIGSMYVRSLNAGSVMMVAGFEFTSTTR